MACHWTLPLIEERLEDLPAGARFAITSAEMTSLFGINSAAVGRIDRFARSHHCQVAYGPAELIFCKLGAPVTPGPVPKSSTPSPAGGSNDRK